MDSDIVDTFSVIIYQIIRACVLCTVGVVLSKQCICQCPSGGRVQVWGDRVERTIFTRLFTRFLYNSNDEKSAQQFSRQNHAAKTFLFYQRYTTCLSLMAAFTHLSLTTTLTHLSLTAALARLSSPHTIDQVTQPSVAVDRASRRLHAQTHQNALCITKTQDVPRWPWQYLLNVLTASATYANKHVS